MCFHFQPIPCACEIQPSDCSLIQIQRLRYTPPSWELVKAGTWNWRKSKEASSVWAQLCHPHPPFATKYRPISFSLELFFFFYFILIYLICFLFTKINFLFISKIIKDLRLSLDYGYYPLASWSIWTFGLRIRPCYFETFGS